MASGLIDLHDFELDVLCYAGEDRSVCEDLEAQMGGETSPDDYRIRSFAIVGRESASTGFNNIVAYPVMVYMTAGTTGQGQDFFDLGKLKDNHIVQFLDIANEEMNALSRLRSSLSKLAMLARQTKSGAVPSEGNLHKFVKGARLHEPGNALTKLHIKDTSTGTGGSKIDCLFVGSCDVQLMTDVKVQAAVFVTCGLMAADATASSLLKASYFLSSIQELLSCAPHLKSTSTAMYVGGEDPGNDMLSKVLFLPDGWNFSYVGLSNWDIAIPSTVIQNGGQLSVLQIAGPNEKVAVSFELYNPGTLAAQTIAGGLNLSVQRDEEIMVGFITIPSEEPGSPSMTVTFTGDWSQVTNLADAKFVFEGDVTVEGKPASATVEYGKISDRPVGPGVPDPESPTSSKAPTSSEAPTSPQAPTASEAPTDPDDPKKPSSHTGVIIGCTVAGIVVVCGIIICVVLSRRRRKRDIHSSSTGREFGGLDKQLLE